MEFELLEGEQVIDRFATTRQAEQRAEEIAKERGLSIEWRQTFDHSANHSASGIATDGSGRGVAVFTVREGSV